MQKKDIAEIRKIVKKSERCTVSRVAVCYVSAEQKVISKGEYSLLTMEEEEQHKYCGLFSKGLSGTPDRNQVTLAFPTAAETDFGQKFLYDLVKSRLTDDVLLDRLCDQIIRIYRSEGNYAIIVAYGDYDIPKKATDNSVIEDGSTDVYSFIQILLCPVSLSKPGLAYSEKKDRFVDSTQSWMIQMPETGILYPAFNHREMDLNECLYYQKKPADPHEEIILELLGCEPPTAAASQTDLFAKTVERALGDACTTENILQVQANVAGFQAEKEAHNEDPEITEADMRSFFQNTDADANEVQEVVHTMYQDAPQIQAPNVVNAKKTTVLTNEVTITASPEYARLIETRVIDGLPYVVIPASIGEMEIDGIKVKKA